MSHRSIPEKELEFQLELYLGIGTFGEIGSSDPKNQKKFFRFKITYNGQKSHEMHFLRCFCAFGGFLRIRKYLDFSRKIKFFEFWLTIFILKGTGSGELFSIYKFHVF